MYNDSSCAKNSVASLLSILLTLILGNAGGIVRDIVSARTCMTIEECRLTSSTLSILLIIICASVSTEFDLLSVSSNERDGDTMMV